MYSQSRLLKRTALSPCRAVSMARPPPPSSSSLLLPEWGHHHHLLHPLVRHHRHLLLPLANKPPPPHPPPLGYVRAALGRSCHDWCLLFVLIRHGLRGGSGPQRLIRALGEEAGNPIKELVGRRPERKGQICET
jgi:hypothetical protein